MTDTSPQLFNESNVTILVADLDAALSFYTGVLGLTLKSRYGGEFAVVQGPGISIGLHPAAKERAGEFSIGFGVDSLDKAMQLLKKRGVDFDGEVIEDPPVRIANFRDPYGIKLYLLEQSEWR